MFIVAEAEFVAHRCGVATQNEQGMRISRKSEERLCQNDMRRQETARRIAAH
jgi:hypothetical protein